MQQRRPVHRLDLGPGGKGSNQAIQAEMIAVANDEQTDIQVHQFNENPTEDARTDSFAWDIAPSRERNPPRPKVSHHFAEDPECLYASRISSDDMDTGSRRTVEPSPEDSIDVRSCGKPLE